MSRTESGRTGEVSVIISIRDRDRLRLRRCLEAIVKQSYPILEIVVVDSGSKPNVAANIRAEVATYSVAKYFYLDTLGRFWNKSLAINCGFHISKGDILLLLDVDLIISPFLVHRVIEGLNLFDLVAHRFVELPKSFKNWELGDSTPPAGSVSHENSLGLLAVRASTFSTCGGFNERFRGWGSEDVEFRDRAILAGYRFISVFVAMVYHQWHEPFATETVPPTFVEQKALDAGLSRKLPELRRDPGIAKQTTRAVHAFIADQSAISHWITVGHFSNKGRTYQSTTISGWQQYQFLFSLARALRLCKVGEAIGVRWKWSVGSWLLGSVVRWILPRYTIASKKGFLTTFQLPEDLIFSHWFLESQLSPNVDCFYSIGKRECLFVYAKTSEIV